LAGKLDEMTFVEGRAEYFTVLYNILLFLGASFVVGGEGIGLLSGAVVAAGRGLSLFFERGRGRTVRGGSAVRFLGL
jgi:hypothetical protein